LLDQTASQKLGVRNRGTAREFLLRPEAA